MAVAIPLLSLNPLGLVALGGGLAAYYLLRDLRLPRFRPRVMPEVIDAEADARRAEALRRQQEKAALQRQLVECLATKVELQRQLDECWEAKPKLKVELELKVQLILELELKIKVQLEIEIKIRRELEECKETKDQLQRELEECRKEKAELQSKLEAGKVKKGELQRQLEERGCVSAEANEEATKACDAEKALDAKIMVRLRK
ncbi:M protein, serotype 12-like [Panicum virgatum]|uniref:Uncharacterized protein n=2 Tax=Panicum virgatum TaxID=38727 RepID=A0A8T0PID1_PANVG|nr:M protein, serotype 12-like [Panicum virgatum]KAG2560678.1 hypothetical protein PVAP13_8KG078100 [Panicum virgatum]